MPFHGLYLALEDDYSRLLRRLNQMFGVETVDGLHFATQARTLAEGLITQLEEFMQLYPNTRLIIVASYSVMGTKVMEVIAYGR